MARVGDTVKAFGVSSPGTITDICKRKVTVTFTIDGETCTQVYRVETLTNQSGWIQHGFIEPMMAPAGK